MQLIAFVLMSSLTSTTKNTAELYNVTILRKSPFRTKFHRILEAHSVNLCSRHFIVDQQQPQLK